MALTHPNHAQNARLALLRHDERNSSTPAERQLADALRVLLYEPALAHQGDLVSCACECCSGR